jgi:hypothetical protein
MIFERGITGARSRTASSSSGISSPVGWTGV